MNTIETLKKFALDNYEAGGHWIVETYSDADYEGVLRNSKTITAAKKELQKCWKLWEEQSSNCW
jgi:hypothetical protein